MRESMARLTPRFSTNRTVHEYTEQHYLPAAAAYRSRSANQGAVGKDIVDWQRSLDLNWSKVHFGEVKVDTRDGQHAFEVQVMLGDVDPEAVRIELYADGAGDCAPVRQEMNRLRQLGDGGYVYGAALSSARRPADYTPRLIPQCKGVAVPLEDARILWQR
jgi:starch phosphorylase